MKTAFYDTKAYDREYFIQAPGFAELDWVFHEFRLTAGTAGSAAGVEAVCAFVNDRLDGDCLRTLASGGVRHVALRCAGFNNVDIEAARALGIRVTRVPAYSPHAVAEHTIALLLTLNRRIHRAYNRVREHNFALAGLVGFDLAGKTVGVVGTGKIGRIVARILVGFGCRVWVNDPFPDPVWAAETGVTYMDFESVVRGADILTLHLPLTPESHHLLDARTLASLRKGAHVVNTSRGRLIDTAALIEALKSGHLGGVALDVYEEEEGVFFEDLSGSVLADDELARLLTFPNVLVTAHQAFLTREALAEIARVSVENLLRASRSEEALSGTRLA